MGHVDVPAWSSASRRSSPPDGGRGARRGDPRRPRSTRAIAHQPRAQRPRCVAGSRRSRAGEAGESAATWKSASRSGGAASPRAPTCSCRSSRPSPAAPASAGLARPAVRVAPRSSPPVAPEAACTVSSAIAMPPPRRIAGSAPHSRENCDHYPSGRSDPRPPPGSRVPGFRRSRGRAASREGARSSRTGCRFDARHGHGRTVDPAHIQAFTKAEVVWAEELAKDFDQALLDIGGKKSGRTQNSKANSTGT